MVRKFWVILGLVVSLGVSHGLNNIIKRSWYRCARCGVYSCQQCWCKPSQSAFHIPLSRRQSRRLSYYQNSPFYWISSQEQGTSFVSFALTLEDLSGQDWTSHTAALIFAQLHETRYLPGFLRFSTHLEHVVNRGPLHLSGVAKLYMTMMKGRLYEVTKAQITPDSSDASY